MSKKAQVLCKKKKKVLGTSDTPEKTVDIYGPTLVCTSTFLKKCKSEVAEMNDDDEDNEIVFKQPISCVKEEIQETQTPTHSQKMKKKQSVIFNVYRFLLKNIFMRKIQKINWASWLIPVVPATREAEVDHMSPGS